MRRAAALELTKRAAQQQVGVFYSTPAPVGGWNARDPIAAMKPTDAVVLENWFPRVADVAMRGGAANHLTATGTAVESLMVYTPPSGINKMFAAVTAGILDATAAGAAGAVVSAATNARWQDVQMGTSGGNFLLMANGVDLMKRFDGTSWTNPAITGPSATSAIIHLNVYKRRLFLIEKAKLNFWYLPIDSVAGAATEFFLAPLCRRGGFTMAMGTWSIDAGSGPDDYAALVTSEGELIVFTGVDPGTASDWSLVGVFYISKPIGRRCFRKIGGDLVILTEGGAVPLSQILKSAVLERTVTLTNKIENAFTQAARDFGASFGWDSIIYPAQSAFIFNIPTIDSGTFEQYVMNTITKSWCKFTGWNARCWVEFNKELYFGGATFVAKAWTDKGDFGGNIIAQAQTAFNYFGVKRRKKVTQIRPVLLCTGPVQYSLGLVSDFRIPDALSQTASPVIAAAVWDVAIWDLAVWDADNVLVEDWRTVAIDPGFCLATLIRIDTNSISVAWAATDYFYESAEGIL